MAIYKYTLPSGAKFVVDAPQGTTQTQADYLFYSQVASGSLVGYTRGQSLSSINTRLTKFDLSRLDRETAGVDTATVLAIILGSPVIASIPASPNVPLTNPITLADYVTTPQTSGVGPLSPEEVQAVNAEVANLVADPEITPDPGVGDYGFTPTALEQAGYLKPGTSNYPDYNCVIGTPSVWTGKSGITSLSGLLSDPLLQAQVQTEILQNGYDALTASGTITTAPTPAASISTGSVYTGSGVLQTLTAPALIAGTAAVTGSLNGLITKAFAGAPNIDALLSNPVKNISTIANGAVNSVTQSISGLGTNALATANGLVSGTLNSLTGQASSLVNNTLGQATGLVSGLSNSVNGAVGGLIANASQFGAPLTALWSQGSGVLNSALGSASGLVTGAVGQATGLINGAIGTATGLVTGAVGELTSLASTALSSLTSQAQNLLGSLGTNLDIFGKMSSFSIDFSLFSSDSLVSATKVAAGFTNTVNRQATDAAVQRILGNAKIPVPKFEFPSVPAAASSLDIAFAQAKLKELGNQVSSGFANLTSTMSSTGIGTTQIG